MGVASDTAIMIKSIGSDGTVMMSHVCRHIINIQKFDSDNTVFIAGKNHRPHLEAQVLEPSALDVEGGDTVPGPFLAADLYQPELFVKNIFVYTSVGFCIPVVNPEN